MPPADLHGSGTAAALVRSLLSDGADDPQHRECDAQHSKQAPAHDIERSGTFASHLDPSAKRAHGQAAEAQTIKKVDGRGLGGPLLPEAQAPSASSAQKPTRATPDRSRRVA